MEYDNASKPSAVVIPAGSKEETFTFFAAPEPSFDTIILTGIGSQIERSAGAVIPNVNLGSITRENTHRSGLYVTFVQYGIMPALLTTPLTVIVFDEFGSSFFIFHTT